MIEKLELLLILEIIEVTLRPNKQVKSTGILFVIIKKNSVARAN